MLCRIHTTRANAAPTICRKFAAVLLLHGICLHIEASRQCPAITGLDYLAARDHGHWKSAVQCSLARRVLRLVCMEDCGYLAVADVVRLVRGGGDLDINTHNDACSIHDENWSEQHSIAHRSAAVAPGFGVIHCGGPGGRVGFGGAAEAILDALGRPLFMAIWTNRHAPHRVLLHVFLADRVSEATTN